ncbi:MAG: bifunctional diaminohydroxyphosphoribosylaminopyrimidine deaminase/5-amino-6-(5-phosphoribosylamino)uracil reductase RibD [Melioribacteraceae bacterium]|nr:bifunctional diaminohydroxyphosphoribosylaminopyrimidine deaminase/5-amino-6-(5-phosphoribosylamino)uracil reductase RibD [Melioribacteraceae bacterium]
MSDIDFSLMERCFNLARKGIGKVSPNPLVGSVLIKNNEIISEGFHEHFGGLHAEANAIKNANCNLSGATMYVNLEPCSHEKKKTPPCVPSIIANNIAKVVIANKDPNPEVFGNGIEKLKDAGIEVVTGVLEEKGKELNKFFFKFMETKLPYVTLKIAKSFDNKINNKIGNQTKITGDEAENYVHRQRAYYDAVLVGANTINIDNPKLSVRYGGGRNPFRVILDSALKSDLKSNVFSDGSSQKTLVFTAEKSNVEKILTLRKKGVKVFELVPNSRGFLELSEILKIIGEEGIISLFVEGGQKVFSQFINAELFDEIITLNAPYLYGDGLDAFTIEQEIELELKEVDRLGKDYIALFKKKK